LGLALGKASTNKFLFFEENMEENKSNNTLLWVLVGLVAVLVIAVVVLAVMVFNRPSEPPLSTAPDPTQPGEVMPTAQPPAPTEGPDPTPIPGDPEKELGKPDGRDEFSTENNWTLYDNECFKSEIINQQYVMTAKGEPQFSCWEVSWPSVQDYYLQTNLNMPQSCTADDRFGLFIRTPDLKQGYLVGLTCDGRLAMTRWDGEESQVLVNFITSDKINTGPGATNRLGVVANGRSYDLYVNGQLLAEASDGSYVDTMRFGYFVRAANEDGFTVTFDDLAIWLIEDE
jgi:hypothetical protein